MEFSEIIWLFLNPFNAIRGVRDFLEMGGNVLFVIMIVNVILMGLIYERFSYFRRGFVKLHDETLNAWNARSDHKSWTAHRIREQLISIAKIGAQKNMGPAGTTLYIFNKKILGNSSVPIPTMLDLKTHFEKDSMFNTPPVFAVYASMLTLHWLKNNGGLDFIEKQNEKKANLLYNQIDNSSLFKGTANLEDRSTMNVTFTLENDDLNETFNNMLADAKINGLKGHRSVGGYRASMYNALSLESVELLVNVMNELEIKKG